MAIRARENLIGAWGLLIGIVLAVLVGLLGTVLSNDVNSTIFGVLAVLGLVIGFVIAEKDAKTFLLAAVSIVIVSFAGIQGTVLQAALGGFNINQFITSILGALLFLLVPSAIIVALKTAFSVTTIK